MKTLKTTFVMCCLLVMAFIGSAQTRDWQEWTADTLTNTDTATFEFSRYLYTQGDFTWRIIADSLSGSTDVTCTIQGTYYPGSTEWTDIATITVDGVLTNSASTTTLYNGIQTRCQCISGGTQSTAIRVADVIYKKRE